MDVKNVLQEIYNEQSCYEGEGYEQWELAKLLEEWG